MQQGTKAHFFIPSVRLLHECGEGMKMYICYFVFVQKLMHLVYFVLHNIKYSWELYGE
jgi:hypothetical protein